MLDPLIECTHPLIIPPPSPCCNYSLSMLNKLLSMPINHMHYTPHALFKQRKSRMYSYGEYKAEDQDQMVANLDKRVSEVYASCIGANEANIL